MVRGERVGRQCVAAIRDSNCHFTLILIHTLKHAARHWSPHQQDQKNTHRSSWAHLSCRQIDCAHEIRTNDMRHINQPVRLAGYFRPKISLLGVLQRVSVSLIWWHEYQKPAEEMDFQNDTGTGSMPNKLLQHYRKGWGGIGEVKRDTICRRTEGRTQNTRQTQLSGHSSNLFQWYEHFKTTHSAIKCFLCRKTFIYSTKY